MVWERVVWFTISWSSASDRSYSLSATMKMMAVTPSKQWIHFLRSDRWPPTSNILTREICTSQSQIRHDDFTCLDFNNTERERRLLSSPPAHRCIAVAVIVFVNSFTVIRQGASLLRNSTLETLNHHPRTPIWPFSNMSALLTAGWCRENLVMISLTVLELS